MHTLITGTLILGYVVILIYALWRVAQDLLVRTATLWPAVSDRDDDAVSRAEQLLSIAPGPNGTIDERAASRAGMTQGDAVFAVSIADQTGHPKHAPGRS